MSLTEGTAIDDHIRILITYWEELIGLGQTLDDAKFAITSLTSPESWNNFFAGIDTTSLKDSSKSNARILEQYQRIKSTNEDTALAAKNSGKFGKKKNPNIKCFKCGKKGHISMECQSKEKKESSDRKDNKSKLVIGMKLCYMGAQNFHFLLNPVLITAGVVRIIGADYTS